MIKETEEQEGVTSSIRVTLKQSRRLGTFLIISSVVLAVMMLIRNRYELIGLATTFSVTGASLIGAVSAAKSYQSKFEQEASND